MKWLYENFGFLDFFKMRQNPPLHTTNNEQKGRRTFRMQNIQPEMF